MSSSVFKAEMMALTGKEHVSKEQYSETAANAYHRMMTSAIDVVSGGGRIVNADPKLPALALGFQRVSDTIISQHNKLNWVQLIAPYIEAYWDGLIIVGATGVVNITWHGTYAAPMVPPNLDFNIIVSAIGAASKVHLATITGVYNSTVVPGVTAPWSGASLKLLG